MTESAGFITFVDALGLPPGARVDARVPKKLLIEHELRWHKRSKDGSGKCDSATHANKHHMVYRLDAVDA